MNEIYDFYNNGAEIGRLERGLGMSPHFLVVAKK